MKKQKQFLFMMALSCLSCWVKAQEVTIVEITQTTQSNIDDKKWALYVNVLGGGYTNWDRKYFTGSSSYTLKGRGWNTGPVVALRYKVTDRFQAGIQGAYGFFFIDKFDNRSFLPETTFNLTGKQLQSAKVGLSLKYDVVQSEHWNIGPCIDAGTFWFTRNDFDPNNQNRMYALGGLNFERKLSNSQFTLFFEPQYEFIRYDVQDVRKRTSVIQNVNLALGFGYHF